MAAIFPHSAMPPPPPAAEVTVAHMDALKPGTRLDEFELQGLLGVGGFGLVYRAYDHSLDRTVAIKEYMPAALAARPDGMSVAVRSAGDQATYQAGLQSFMAEARLLAKFDHPSLVKVYRFWEANNTAYMAMPLYRGMTLSEARREMVAPPPEAWLRAVIWSVLQGLHVLHRNDTLHRDISPDNIFLQDIGPPVLLDLGAARRAINDKSRRLTAILKVNYAPIEQYAETDDLKQGPWTDLYALAAVVYSCMRNEPPLPATTRAVRDSMPAVRRVAATVKEHFGISYSNEFVRAIQHALAVQPGDRPQNLVAFVTEMKLKAPPRLNKFDWRAELGSSWRSDETEHSRQFWDTQQAAQTVFQADLPATRSGGWRRMPVWGWAAGLAAVAGVAGVLAWNWWDAHDRRADVPSPPFAATPSALASPPATPASAAIQTTEVPAPAAVPESHSATSAAAPAGVAAAAVTAMPKPKAAADGESVARPERPARTVRPAEAGPSAPERKPATRTDEGVTPTPGASQQSAPATAAAPPASPAEDRVLCADANFFTRPMCIHLECQKAENAHLPVCIENRKRYPDGQNPASQ